MLVWCGGGVVYLVSQVPLGAYEGLVEVHVHGARDGPEQQRPDSDRGRDVGVGGWEEMERGLRGGGVTGGRAGTTETW